MFFDILDQQALWQFSHRYGGRSVSKLDFIIIVWYTDQGIISINVYNFTWRGTQFYLEGYTILLGGVHTFTWRGIYGGRSVSKLDYYNYSMVYLDIISIIVKLFMCTLLFGHFFFCLVTTD